jgi:hypothetical protein
MSDIGAGLFSPLAVSASAHSGVPACLPLTASGWPNEPISFLPLTANANANEPISFLALTAVGNIVTSGGLLGALTAAGDDNLSATGLSAFAPLTSEGYGLDTPAFAPLTSVGSDEGVGSGAASFMAMSAIVYERGTKAFAPMTAVVSERAETYFLPLTASAFGILSTDTVTPENPHADPFDGWAMNYESNAPSRYTGLPANSFCQFNGVSYLANAAGIYSYGADDDAGQPIRAAIMLPNTDYGSDNNKRLHDVWLAVRTPVQDAKKLRMKVIADNNAGYYYPVTPRTTSMRASHVKVGLGLKGRFWQLGLTNIDGADFELESIAFTPIILKRNAKG